MILDRFMPGLSGLWLLDQLDDPPPVLLVTAHDYDTEVWARRDTIFLYLQKPVPHERQEDAARNTSPEDSALGGNLRRACLDELRLSKPQIRHLREAHRHPHITTATSTPVGGDDGTEQAVGSCDDGDHRHETERNEQRESHDDDSEEPHDE